MHHHLLAPFRRASLRRAGVLALAGPLGPGACRDLTAPLAPDAVRFVPPPAYARWWALTEACSGLAGDFAAYTWYTVPRPLAPADSAGYYVAGETDTFARRVVLDATVQSDGAVVRHEMLHALLGPAFATGGPARVHPPAYFQYRCAGVVTCGPVGCADAGPPPAPPPDAPLLPLAALDVHVDALPAQVRRTGATWADRALTIVVRATNPSRGPVWVPLHAVADQPAGIPAPWFPRVGFRIVPAGQPLPVAERAQFDSTGAVFGDTTSRIAFGAGQTRWFVVDWSGRLYPAGDYVAVGLFNTHQVWTPLTIAP